MILEFPMTTETRLMQFYAAAYADPIEYPALSFWRKLLTVFEL